MKENAFSVRVLVAVWVVGREYILYLKDTLDIFVPGCVLSVVCSLRNMTV